VTSKTKPAVSYAALTKSDSTVYSPPYRALYVGGDGNVVLVAADGSTATFTGLVAGTILPVEFVQLMSTDTTATALVGLL